ncbi:asparagine--tRNA ligase [Vulcanisaeta distributa]|uniref:Asparagine--tRNA ligase n=1 Tax=Vulcanisaeta distributa (strain DSM 14429 / JCM 11212 / NBRC 100878 / IC-017) TaxID=572478 RepID=E1QSZ3_VULDI|nr:asparagine--tRNA ligase [Vulcanisaeta distributa]ADN50860.1 asparaginyl-tRNA synthetase [Vulcanisaeta distributa DSM 14429]
MSIKDVFSLNEGAEVTIRGWVYRKRELKDKIFLVVRDGSGIIQAVINKSDPNTAGIASKLNIESSLMLTGVVKKEPRAPGGAEVHVRSIDWYYIGDPFPINEDAAKADSEYLLDVRHLWIRSRRMWAILRVRHTVFGAIHEFFRSRGYYEVQGPMFVSAAVEGGATLFPVKYFDREDVYLTQSSQFYLEVLIYTLEKVYTVAPSFRAEPSRTRRHLTEFWHAEAEEAWLQFDGLLNLLEDLITYIVNKVLEERQDELKLLNRDTKILENVKPPFYRVSYDEAIEILQSKGLNIKWGDDIGADEERVLTMQFDKPILLHHFPEQVKAFYHRNDPSRPGTTLSVDVLAPEGYGEIVGGGERIYDYEELLSKIKKFGLKPEDYDWYLDLRRYGSVPHAGFGLGVDRLVMWVCGLDHIRDALPFPRDIRRVKP